LCMSQKPSDRSAPGTLRLNRRPLSGRSARHPDHPFSKWNVDGKPVDRDILTLETDAILFGPANTKQPAGTSIPPTSSYKPLHSSGRPMSSTRSTRAMRGHAVTSAAVPVSPGKTRRPRSAHVNYPKVASKGREIVGGKPRWNIESSLDPSRESGPRITKHPGVSAEKARASAVALAAKWKPVNARFFVTTNTEFGF